ncbi:hypothetical protein Tco_1289061, partial [Tanacetum coccineum]
VDVDVEGSDEPHLEPEIDPIEAVIEACFDFADIIRASEVDVRVKAATVAQDDVETSTRDQIMVSNDRDTPSVVPEVIPEPAQEGSVEGTYETLGDLVQRIRELERDKRRLRDIVDVESQRVTRFWRRELRQIRRFRFYDCLRISRLEACAKRHLGYRS